LEAEAQSERAVEQFVIAASLDAERPEPAVALARALRAGGRSDEARARLEPHLARTGNRGLWDLWLAIALADLKLEPEEILKHMPQEDEARPAVEWMRGVRADLPGDLRWLFTRLAKREAVRIHCGGPGWTGPDGTSWSHDRFFTSGNTFGNGRYLFPGEIEGTDADPLYRGERYFPALEPGLAAYTFPLTRGRYRVTLHFAEIHFRAPGQRVFDVLIEGETVLEAFDPGAAGFATAVERPFEVAVEDGRLEIGFRKRINHPKVSAIEIVSLP
jgi:hypothetical protein